MSRDPYVARCPKCGGWQSFHSAQRPRNITMKCRRCQKSTKVHDKQGGGLRIEIQRVNTLKEAQVAVMLHEKKRIPSVKAALEAAKKKGKDLGAEDIMYEGYKSAKYL